MPNQVLRTFIPIFCLNLVAAAAAEPTTMNPLPPFSEVKAAVEEHFASQRDRQPRDLISRSEAEQALNAVKKLGWNIADQQEILALTLSDQHVMVRTFRTPAGMRYMRQIAGRELMFDRFDRISEVSGGAQLIQDIVKLPDGERYAKPKSGGGVPDLLDLLPKNASGQTRRIADYHKPTGHLYTVADLIERLSKSYQEAEKEAPNSGSD